MPIESAKFGASGNNLRQIPYVKGKLETRVAKGSVMQLPRVRYTVRTMMAAVLVVALLMAWLYDWSGRRERCYEIASREAAFAGEYRDNAHGDPDMLRIAAWHDHMRQTFENSANRPWEPIPKSVPSPPSYWKP